MADFTIKRHDTTPAITAILNDGNGNPIDLTSATSLAFKMRLVAGTSPQSSVASIITPASGLVRYQWTGTDTAVSGSYYAEWEITWNDGKVQTVPNDSYMTITIVDDLDAP